MLRQPLRLLGIGTVVWIWTVMNLHVGDLPGCGVGALSNTGQAEVSEPVASLSNVLVKGEVEDIGGENSSGSRGISVTTVTAILLWHSFVIKFMY